MEQVKIFRWRQPYGDGSCGAIHNPDSWTAFERSVNEWLAEQRPRITRVAHADYDHGHSIAIYYTVDVPNAKGEQAA